MLVKCQVCGSVTDSDTNESYFQRGTEAYDLEQIRKDNKIKDDKITALENKIKELENKKTEDNEEEERR